MKSQHYSDEFWSDYVRGVLPATESADIKQHLDQGCNLCARSVRLWQMVAEIAGSEARNPIPEDAEKNSLAAFLSWRNLRLIPQRARMARLVFDSLFQPLPAGVRGEAQGGRRVLWRSGQWSVNIRFEKGKRRKRCILIGQVLQSGEPRKVPERMPVLLMSTDALLSQTAANSFGEFQFEFDRANSLQLYIDFPRRPPIGIQLPDLEDPPSASQPS